MLLPNDTILEVDKVSKIFSRSRSITQQRLRRTFLRALYGRSFDETSVALQKGEFRAVNDVSFSLRRGEALGIIGLNGSGKTTLLRILAGQLLPDSGQITVVGKTASMIDLTAGFQPGASGRENIFLRGAALGRSREQTQGVYDSIVDFSELGDAISAPVATYSSGMTMRLAFSIVAAAAPDLLFIDEILAVGDFRFRQKCLDRVREMRAACGIVLVSHSMADIKRFCDRAILMSKGSVSSEGSPQDVIDAYYGEQQASTAGKRATGSSAPQAVTNADQGEQRNSTTATMHPASSNGLAILDEQPVPNQAPLPKFLPPFDHIDTDALAEITVTLDSSPVPAEIHLQSGKSLSLGISLRLRRDVAHLVLGLSILSSDGDAVSGISSDMEGLAMDAAATDEVHAEVTFEHFPLNPGRYHLLINAREGVKRIYRKYTCDIIIHPVYASHFGIVTLPHTWNFRKMERT